MLKITGAPLPEGSDAELAAILEVWESAIFPGLPYIQRAHIRSFAPGLAIRARLSRSLARMMILRERAFGDKPDWRRVGFSHSGRAAFCISGDVLAPRAVIDAEPPIAAAEVPGMAAFFAQLPYAGRMSSTSSATELTKLWTLWECLIKLLQPQAVRHLQRILALANPAGRSGGACLNGKPICWRWLALPGHWLCVAHYGTTPQRIDWRWLNWHGICQTYAA